MSLPGTLNIADCFDDLISMKGVCSTQTPTSGLYVDDAGVTLYELNKYIGREYNSGAELFEAKRGFAISIIENQINTFLSAKYTNNTLLNNKRVGFYGDNQLIESSPGGLGGIKFRLQNQTSYLKTFFAEVSLCLNYTGNVDVYLYDLVQGSILQSFQIACLPGEISSVYPQITIPSSRQLSNLALVYDTTGKNSYKSVVDTDGCSACSNYSITCSDTTVQGITIGASAQKIEQSCQTLSHTCGMSVVFSVSCNNRGWLCSIGNLLAVPLIYKTCELLMEYGLFNVSERVNNQTIIPEKLEERREMYQGKYDSALKNILKNIALPTDTKCFECSQPVRYDIMIP